MTQLTTWQDAKYVVNPMQRDKETARNKLASGPNGDIWSRLNAATRRSDPCTVSWTKGHVTAEAVVKGRADIHRVFGNIVADAASNAVAAKCMRDRPAMEYIAQWEGRTFAIARRLAILEAEYWRDGQPLVHAIDMPGDTYEPPPMEEVRSKLEIEIQKQGHLLFGNGPYTFCARCRMRTRKNATKWMRPCKGAPKDTQAAGAEPADAEGAPRRTEDAARPAAGRTTDASVLAEGTQDGAGPTPKAKNTLALRSYCIKSDESKLVTPATRRIQQKRARETMQDITAKDEKIIQRAAKQHRAATPAALDEWYASTEEDERAREPRLQTFDGSHTCIAMGGFTGCIKCGGVAGFQRSELLEGACRRHCPSGSAGPIRRLMMSKLPHPQRKHQGRVWPSGEAEPTLRRWRPTAAEESRLSQPLNRMRQKKGPDPKWVTANAEHPPMLEGRTSPPGATGSSEG